MAEIKTAIGLMSGTSMDGIDVALIKTDGGKYIERGPNGFFPYSPEFRKKLEQSLVTARKIRKREERPDNLGGIEIEITEHHVVAVQRFLEQNNLSGDTIDVLGFHGQTVLHRPQNALTVQLGDGQMLATKTGIKTVFDMRANDMVHGGQGAPLVPVYHKALAENLPEPFCTDQPVVFVNIGGISNITYVGEELIAFDAGPGNALIDQWVLKNVGIPYDDGGIIAAEGRVDHQLVSRYMADPFFEKPVPKSLDRNDFEVPCADAGSVETVARSLARVTAEAIFSTVDHLPEPPALWIVCGGGRHNPNIMTDLAELIGDVAARVIKADDIDLNGDAIEAESWAFLAVRSLLKLPLTFPKTTGVNAPVHGGLVRSP